MSVVFENTTISSRYTSADGNFTDNSIKIIATWNISGAFFQALGHSHEIVESVITRKHRF